MRPEADAIRRDVEERAHQGFSQEENPNHAEPPSWLERRNEMLRRKLQGEENE